MKKAIELRKCLIGSTFALAVVVLAWLPNQVLAQEKGAQKLMRVQTVEDLQKLDVGDIIVMSCPKCKESYAQVVEKTYKSVKPEELKNVTIHLCSTCDTRVVTKGIGKRAKAVLVHTCKMCGSKNVTCFAIKKGSLRTEGMEEH